MLQAMKRIQVIGPKAELGRAVDLLYRAGTVHLENAPELIPKDEICLNGVRQEEADEITGVLGTISAIFSTLPVIADDPRLQAEIRTSLERKDPRRTGRTGPGDHPHPRNDDTGAGGKEKRTLPFNHDAEPVRKVLDIIQPVEKELPALEGFEVTILLIQEEHREVLELIKKELDTITGNRFEMIATTVDADTLAAIMVFPKKYSEEIHSFIYSVNVNEVRLPKEYTGRPFYEMYALLEESRLRAQDEIARIDAGPARSLEYLVPGTRCHKKAAETINGELGAYRNFGVSDYTFVIMGWIPKKIPEQNPENA